MLVMRGVTLAFLGARLADARANLQQLDEHLLARLSAARRDRPGRETDIRAIEIEPPVNHR